jgi:hypothetical protein
MMKGFYGRDGRFHSPSEAKAMFAKMQTKLFDDGTPELVSDKIGVPQSVSDVPKVLIVKSVVEEPKELKVQDKIGVPQSVSDVPKVLIVKSVVEEPKELKVQDKIGVSQGELVTPKGLISSLLIDDPKELKMSDKIGAALAAEPVAEKVELVLEDEPSDIVRIEYAKPDFVCGTGGVGIRGLSRGVFVVSSGKRGTEINKDYIYDKGKFGVKFDHEIQE